MTVAYDISGGTPACTVRLIVTASRPDGTTTTLHIAL